MKTKQIINSLVIGCVGIFLYSCTGGSNTGKMLVKKWQVESIKSTDIDKQMVTLKQMADTAKDSAMKAEIDNRMKMNQSMMDAFKSMVVEYKADSTFEQVFSFMGKPQTLKGKWMLTEDKDTRKIISTDERNMKDTIIIIDITADKFTVSSPDKSLSITYKAIKS